MPKQTTRTISGSASEALAERVKHAASMEDRSPSQIVISALELYTRLSPETHLALRRIEQVAGKHAVERILTEFGHHILDRQFDAALDAAAAQIGETHVRGLESDEQFLSAASTAVAQTSGRR